MNKLKSYRKHIKKILQGHSVLPISEQGVETQLAFDDEHGCYQLIHGIGQDQNQIYRIAIQINLKEECAVWIQYNNTEADLVTELIEAGILQEDINKYTSNFEESILIEALPWLLIVAAGSIFIATIMYFDNFYFNYLDYFDGKLSESYSDWGTFGDFFGGTLNPILSFLGLIALLSTIKLQIRELKETRIEFKRSADAQQGSKEALDLQAKMQKRQQFENTFFSLLNQHNSSLNIVSGLMRDKNFNNINIEQKIEKSLQEPSIRKANQKLKEYDYLWGGYFRILYQLLKFLFVNYPTASDDHMQKRKFTHDNLKKEVDIDEKMYANMIRAFLNHQVTQVLSINCYHEEGYNETYIEYKLLVERYSFLEHMPFTYNNGAYEVPALKATRKFYSKQAFGKNIFIQET